MKIKVKCPTITKSTQTDDTWRRKQIKRQLFYEDCHNISITKNEGKDHIAPVIYGKSLIKNSDRNKTAIFGQAFAMKNDFV